MISSLKINQIIIVIGVLAIGVGIFNIIQDCSIDSFWLNIVIGVLLVGDAIINKKMLNNLQDEDN